jgi:hypothetical protein
MKPTIEILVSPAGDITIEGHGFKGADCQKATHFVENALGLVNTRQKKPEYHQPQARSLKQSLGS